MNTQGAVRLQAPGVEVVAHTGAGSMSNARENWEPRWKGVGILYAKEENGVVSFELYYEPHIEQEVKEEIAERFGIGAHEWRVVKS